MSRNGSTEFFWAVRSGTFQMLNRLGIFVYWVNARPLHHHPLPELPPGITVQRADHETCYRAAKEAPLDMPTVFVNQALARGDMCHVAFIDGDVVAYAQRATTGFPTVVAL